MTRSSAPLSTSQDRHTSRRRCAASGERAPKEGMVRLVVDPGGLIVPDIAERLPGRGIWVSAQRAAVRRAAADRRLIGRQKVGSPKTDLADEVERQLARSALNWLGLARRAGAVSNGFDSVCRALGRGRVGALVEARDAAADGARRVIARAEGKPVVTLFDGEELSRALGRDNVVHIALDSGRITDQFLAECGRLAGFRDSRAGLAANA